MADTGSGNSTTTRDRASTAFGWIHRPAPPLTRRTVRLPATTEVLAYPADMAAVRSDPGTVSVERRWSGRLLAYLNATPVEGGEAGPGFAAFRLTHLRDEGARDVRLEAADARLTVGERVASCVVDTYTNGPAIERYREVACLVSDRGSPRSGDRCHPPGVLEPAVTRRRALGPRLSAELTRRRTTTGGDRKGSVDVTAEHGRP